MISRIVLDNLDRATSVFDTLCMAEVVGEYDIIYTSVHFYDV